jgi:hypothetical protein
MDTKKIKRIRVSLLEKNYDKSYLDSEHHGNFIKRSTGTLDFQKLLRFIAERGVAMEPNDLIVHACKELYDEQKSTFDKYDIHSVGVWIEDDEKTIQNSMSLELLADMERYSDDVDNGFEEFVKMTLNREE